MARNNTNTANGLETEKLLNRTIPSEGSPRIEFRSPHRRELLIMREINQIENRLSLYHAAREGIVKYVRNHCQSATNLDEKDTRGLTALHYAAFANQVQVVEVLLEYGAAIDTQGVNGMTPLQLAVRYNCKKAVELLLEKGADPSITNTEGSTALHFAARRGYKEITGMLLADQRTNVNHSDYTKTTPFHLASFSGCKSVCQMLLKHGADTTARTAEGRLPLHLASSQGHEEVMQLLITHGSALLDSRDVENNTALHLACGKGHVEVARLCLSHGADVNAEQGGSFNTPQHLAAKSGVVELVELLIANGAEIDAWDGQQRTPLHRAASYNHLNVIKVLLNNGAKIDSKDKDGYTPFLTAVRFGRTEAANFLLESGAEMSACDESMKSCLHLAVKYQHLETLRMLLDLADTALLHDIDKDMMIALHYAASSGNFEMVKALLEKKCAAGFRDVSERTALHLAASHGHVTCVDLLGKAAPTHVNDHDELGLTPLHLAAIKGNSDVCATLLHIGADVTARDSNRRTPLHCASETGRDRAVEVLLSITNVTSELEAQDNKNDTPLHLASRNGHAAVVELLLKKGADVMTRNNKGMTSLDVAIQERRGEVAKCFVQDDRWFDLFLSQTKECQRPMKHLIEKLPDIAKIAMDRCVTYSEHDPSDPNFSASFDFRLLDPGPDEETTGSEEKFFGPTTMVQHNRETLLLHPLTHALLRWKWVILGKGVYYLNLLIYLIFVSLVTTFVVNSRSRVRIFLNATEEANQDHKLFNNANRGHFSLSVPILVVIFAIAQMIKELYQIYLQRLKYFKQASNLLDWLVYVWALFFMIPFISQKSHFNVGAVLWPSGAGLVLLSFANLISSLRRFGFFGIYIAMFLEVIKTALRVLLVFSLFIIGFAIAFFILFKEQLNFKSVGWSFVKTTMMMFGELDYGATIVDSLGQVNPDTGAPLVPAPLPSVAFFYTFCVLMSVLLMNLLVGLAVGDIETIRKNATISAITLRVEFVAEVDQRYPGWVLRKVYQPTLRLKPNKLQGILQRLMIYSLEDTSLGLNRDFFVKPEDEAADERLEKAQEQIEDQRGRMENFQNMLHEQNKLLKLMAAKLGVQEGLTLNALDFVHTEEMLDSSEGIGGLQARNEEDEGSIETVQRI